MVFFCLLGHLKPYFTGRVCVLLTSAMLVTGCAVNPVTGGNDFVLMTERDELTLGRKYSQQLLKTYRHYDNALLQQYVQSVGERLARVSHRQKLLYQFTVLDSADVNAFALPGGYIYITRGLLAYLNSESELAAVLAHELGHVTARHSVRQHGLSTATNVLGQFIAIGTGMQGMGELNSLISAGINSGYGRGHELEADGLGVQYLIRAGYQGSAMMSVITVLKNQELFDRKLAEKEGRQPRVYHGVFSTHPKNDERLQAVLAQAKGGLKPLKGWVKQDVNFLNKLEGLTFGASAKDGVIRGRHFYHADLNFKIQFPKAWAIKNNPNSIIATSLAGDAFIRWRLQSHKATSAKQVLKKALNNHKVLEESSVPMKGGSAYSAIIRDALTGRPIRLTAIVTGDRVFSVYASAKTDAAFLSMDKHFLKTIKSFSALTRADRRKAREFSLHLVKVRGRGGLEAFAKASPIADHAEEQLRLINNLFPTGTPKLGDQLKIVR